jgi:hypothetical protein
MRSQNAMPKCNAKMQCQNSLLQQVFPAYQDIVARGLVTLDEVALFRISGPVEVLNLAVEDWLGEGVEAAIVGQRGHRHHRFVQACQKFTKVVFEYLILE